MNLLDMQCSGSVGKMWTREETRMTGKRHVEISFFFGLKQHLWAQIPHITYLFLFNLLSAASCKSHVTSRVCRWRWSRTCWTIRCVTSARERAVEASSPRSSVPTSRACSTTVSTAGPASTRAPAASSTNRWWRREETDHAMSPSAGADGGVTSLPHFFTPIIPLQPTNYHHHHHHNYNRR